MVVSWCDERMIGRPSTRVFIPLSHRLVRALDALAHGIYAVQHSRVVKVALAIVVVLTLVGLALARPIQSEDTTIYTMAVRDVTSASIGRYVRVTGTLLPEAAYQTELTALGVPLRGGRYIPMLGEGAYDPLFVLDQNLPPLPQGGATVTLVGRIVPGTGQQPTYYLEVGDPPNLALMNRLAQLSLFVLALALGALGVAWYARRADYAFGLPFIKPAPAPDAPSLLWFGDLGRPFRAVFLRQAPAVFSATRAEATFSSADSHAEWAVICRRLLSVDETVVATRYGALPALRIEFEDERGLRRRAVLATNSRPARAALAESLRFVGLHGG
ncbi:MAG: hypothetical protein RMN25_02215 [Anaerolineae bacterium]|nr:hypothetical protein [Thermoflexales bacterium]MDW8406571.1 hypothetical protein [Anaerolineae bacterium]